MELFLLYIWLKLDDFRALLVPFTFLMAIACVVLFVWIRTNDSGPFMEDPEKIDLLKNKFKVHRRVYLYGAIALALLHLVVPTSKETAVLVAGHYALEFSKSNEGQKTWQLIRKTANNMLDSMLKEATK